MMKKAESPASHWCVGVHPLSDAAAPAAAGPQAHACLIPSISTGEGFHFLCSELASALVLTRV